MHAYIDCLSLYIFQQYSHFYVLHEILKMTWRSSWNFCSKHMVCQYFWSTQISYKNIYFLFFPILRWHNDSVSVCVIVFFTANQIWLFYIWGPTFNVTIQKTWLIFEPASSAESVCNFHCELDYRHTPQRPVSGRQRSYNQNIPGLKPKSMR